MGGPGAPEGVCREPKKDPGAAREGPGRSGSKLRFSGFRQPALGSLLQASSEPLGASQDALRRKKPPTWRVRPGQARGRKERKRVSERDEESWAFDVWGGNGGTCRCGAVWFQGLGSGGETCWAVFTWAGTGKEAAEACKRVKSREIDFGRVDGSCGRGRCRRTMEAMGAETVSPRKLHRRGKNGLRSRIKI